ncbi:eukaryotic translation initiation factor 4 gamma 2-like [Diorhabda sublineata]|uniref:eukaryotic translation initiation factor 4 gamma 2-like n=1 Tax=Diorhabda sublineata TaxID=1163346 RepID=UPI0024E0DC2C|nr:eukaryotic translation initiation factor 4 gamma 2-like [Diorhabda sublineata]
MYAQLCKRLSEEAPNFESPNQPTTFRVLLLNKCKLEFENRAAALENNGASYAAGFGGANSEEEEERRQIAKRKMLGNIKFIGELGKLEILSENILHLCIKELLVRRGDDFSEDLECLCQILRTCGRILDTNKGKNLMNQYFERMKMLAESQDLQPRIRFMLKDVIDLRDNGWVPRKAVIVEGPMPINHIKPAEDDRPVGFRRDRNHDRDQDRPNIPDLFRHPMKTRSGLDDMLMGINLTPSAPSLIPTAPPFGAHNGFGSQRDGSYRGHNNQRSGAYNYNNQRGQYKHNQNNSQFNQSNKELAPRFKKSNLIVGKDEMADVELRPNSMLITKASSLKNNNMMNNNKSLEPTFAQPTTKQPPSTLLKDPLPIKQLPAEKPKQSKKDKGPNKEEVLKKFNTLIEEFWKGEVDLKQAINSYKEHKVPDKFAKEMVLSGLSTALEKSDVEQEKLIRFLSNLKEDNLISGNTVQDAFKSLCNVLDERENEITKVTNSASVLFATAICEHLVPLSDVANLTENGAHHPLFLLVLQNIHKKRGKSELSEMFNKSKINLMSQLPDNDKTKERLSEILEERDLTFLYPLLRIQADLARQLQADPNPQAFYKWIKENLEPSNFNDPGFINALMTVLLKYITQESSACGDEKAIIEKESGLLKRYQPILTAFLRDKSSLQLVALYSLQMHFHSLGFPRGQLLRWFNALYDMEIVDEEAFLNWKEDVTDAYPGKGNALFQVNQWLTWLQEAESEEEEGDD